MRRFITGIMAAGICLAFAIAGAEGYDISQYSYDELIALRETIDARLDDIAREEAIANADRLITFENDEMTVFTGRSASQRPAIERLSDDAPWRTHFEWSSSAPEIATVDETGVVTARSAGDALITATTTDNKYLCASYTVHAAVPVEKINLWGAEEPLALRNEGESTTASIGYSIEPEDATFQGIQWSSSDETIATVDETGTITALQPGTVTITATSTEDPPADRIPKQESITISVIQLVTDITAEPTSGALSVGETAQIIVTALPENARNRNVLYTTDNAEIAIVDEYGNVTGIAPGECIITCTAKDGSGTSAQCNVTVLRKVTRLTLSEESIRVPVGTTRLIEAVTEPEDASNPNLYWTSSNILVAWVANGVIEAVGEGECEITCSTTDGSEIAATLQVRVPSFSVDGEAYTVTEKSGIQIPIRTGRKELQVEISYNTECFTAEMADGLLKIQPIQAGKGTIILRNPDAEKDTTEILITVEDSAVFNQVSYPNVSYEELAQKPGEYEGKQISLFGRVIQENRDEEGNTILMVGTGGAEYTDQVVRVHCGSEWEDEIPQEEMRATFYGIFRNEKVFSEALGSEVTVPGLEAEKIEIKRE